MKIDNKIMNEIASYMIEGIREDVHAEFAPCSNETFIKEYIKRDKKFVMILEDLFNIEMEDLK